MNNKQRVDESAAFWLGLLGAKAAKIFGISLSTFLTYKGAKSLLKNSGGIKGVMSTLRDKKALRAAGFTDDEIRALWSKNGKNLNDLATILANETIVGLKNGALTPEDALKMYNGYIPKGEAASTLEKFRKLYKTTATTTSDVAKNVVSKIKFKRPVNTTIDKVKFDKAYQQINGMESAQTLQSKYNYLNSQLKQGNIVIPDGPMPSLREFSEYMRSTTKNAERWNKKSLSQQMVWYNQIKLMHTLLR